jgi:hypothetical protein
MNSWSKLPKDPEETTLGRTRIQKLETAEQVGFLANDLKMNYNISSQREIARERYSRG